MSKDLQTLILNHLTHDEVFCRKAIPHLKPEYFENEYRAVHGLILEFIARYNKLPNKATLEIELANSKNIPDGQRIPVARFIAEELDEKETVELEWLLDSTEKWCKDRAVYLAIMESISIINGDVKDKGEGVIPEILSDALAVTFDTNIGHDYIENADERFEFYNRAEDKIPFNIDILNTITNGGIVRKSLSIFAAGTGTGKSLAMCDFAAGHLEAGYNVLYITMEMAEERIAERIDANLLDVDIHELKNLSKDMFNQKIKRIAGKTQGRLIVKEYPTAAAHVGHFRALLQELRLKKDFVPDIIYIDYLNICASSRVKNINGGTYGLVKAIAEELRGLAVEYNVAIISATQLTRGAQQSSDIELSDISESVGTNYTADFVVSISTDEQLEKLNQVLFKQLKNRYNDLNKNKKFCVGIDRAKMRLYDIEDPMANITKESTESVVAQTPFQTSQTRKQFTGFKV